MSKNLVSKASEGIFSNPYIRSLTQLVPGGGTLDILVQERVDRIKKERFEILINELIEGNLELTEEIIQSEEFIHAYLQTAKAVSATQQKEKIKLMADLFISSYKQNSFSKVDEYEELLQIVKDLSTREMNILFILEVFENNNPKLQNENMLQRCSKFWTDFENEVQHKLGLNPSLLESALSRLQRTGLYSVITGAFMDYEGGQGYLTDSYYQLRRLIINKMDSGDI
ncbi:hypothetical protein Q4493_06070 [Colwellia sp. 1_MG-2023]|uniref:hypothetical protein n=1 Tax=Colwellia sp. 1_MG-2023 TaxID=3062649 RepID=UPI0026E1388A|nr:hypothetical protein [Colwellia sp. 1_MG-2023]MDO6445341.1 hypothetical protein [Colwellia sp. 1_MG-2023]